MVHLVCNCKTNKDPFIGTMIFIAFRDNKMADLNFEPGALFDSRTWSFKNAARLMEMKMKV